MVSFTCLNAVATPFICSPYCPLSNKETLISLATIHKILAECLLLIQYHVFRLFVLMLSAFVKKITGKMVIRGKPSKDFHPYMPLNKGAVKSLHDARDKLLVNFDPTAYFVRDLKVTLKIDFKYVPPFRRLLIYAFIQKIISVYLVCISEDLQAVVWFSWRRCSWSYLGEPEGIKSNNLGCRLSVLFV
jgi:hypothetical protein